MCFSKWQPNEICICKVNKTIFCLFKGKVRCHLQSQHSVGFNVNLTPLCSQKPLLSSNSMSPLLASLPKVNTTVGLDTSTGSFCLEKSMTPLGWISLPHSSKSQWQHWVGYHPKVNTPPKVNTNNGLDLTPAILQKSMAPLSWIPT